MKFFQPSSMFNSKIRCNLCGQSHFIVIEDDQEPFKVLKCSNCSLVFVYPQPDPAELKSHYNNGYYKEWMKAQKQERIAMWTRRLKKINKLRSPGRLLDVGCGEGTFLSLAQKNGWQVSGTEISAFASKHASGLLNTDIFHGDLPSGRFKENSFDVVTMWHVLEHVGNPKLYLSEIHRILKPEGLFVLAVPNVNNTAFQVVYRMMKRRRLKLFKIGEKEVHLYHFSPKTIKHYLYEARLECLKLSPDFGIIGMPKKIINLFAVIFYYFFRVHIFDAIEIIAIPARVNE